MSKTSKKVIIVSVTVLFIIFLVVYSVLRNNSNKIPAGTLGNTTGNLYNKGLFCETDDRIYFSNPYDYGKLYSMKPDQTDIKKHSDLRAQYINAGGNFVFFFGKNTAASTGFGSVLKKPSIVMLKKNGESTVLTNDATQSMLLVDNNLYYQHYSEKEGVSLYEMDVNKRKITEVLDYMIDPSGYTEGKIFFNGMYDDHYLYSLDLDTHLVEVVWEGDIWFPTYDGEYVYYMDVRNNYRLCRYSAKDNTIEVLTNERLDFFNVYNSVIYYQVSSSKNPRLMRMNKDGSNQETVLEGVFSSVCCTSNYTYFYTYDTGYPIYCTPTTGSISVREFNPGVKSKK